MQGTSAGRGTAFGWMTLVVALWGAGSALVGHGFNGMPWWGTVLCGLVPLVLGHLVWRGHRQPVVVFGLVWGVSLGFEVADAWQYRHAVTGEPGASGTVDLGSISAGLALMVVLVGYQLGRRSRWQVAVGLGLVMALLRTVNQAWVFSTVTGPTATGETPPALLVNVVTFNTIAQFVLLPIGLGILVQHELREAGRARRALEDERADREQLITRTVRDDRQRMAHELHDLAAHHTTAVVINAKAARKLGASRPDLVPELMDEIVEESSGAQTSLRQMVRLLNDPDEAPLQPQPTLAEIPALVEKSRSVNPDVVLEQVDVEVPPTVALAAHRIVQEALTNALRYAPGAPLTIFVGPVEDVLQVEVLNGRSTGLPEEGLGTGNGIAGMRQRAELLGGSLVAGPHGNGWRVLAELPLDPNDPEEAA